MEKKIVFADLMDDRPIDRLTEDLFGRKRLVENIVKSIVDKSKRDHPCYTIGIYGKWGTGKTSLLNMVREEIDSERGAIKVVTFNPWLFKDQESLLLDFFKVLEEERLSRQFVNKIKKYGPLVSLGLSGLINICLPGTGGVVKKTMDDWLGAIPGNDLNIQKLKIGVNDSIVNSKKHLVICVDDVDRLDKDELHILFKLIRQNADFMNTTYLIAMDEDMVAKSIGERFEDGDEQAGKHFLEKIIQVPIKLPKIQQGHLFKLLYSNLCVMFNKLDESDKSNIYSDKINKDLENYVFPLFSTAREIFLYMNSLSFILPLVYGEVNLSDLCMLEALKLFHSEAYHIIRENKYLITGYLTPALVTQALEDDTIKQKRKDGFIAKLMKADDSSQSTFINEMITHLLYPFIHTKNADPIERNNQKRLCSPVYFDKYFVYDVPDDVIPDREFDSLLENISRISEGQLLDKFDFYYKQYDYSELARVIRGLLYNKFSHSISNDCIGKICIVLSRMPANRERIRYVDDGSHPCWEIMICEILERYVNDFNDDPDYETIMPNRRKALDIFKNILAEKELLLFHLFLATHFCDRCGVYFNMRDEADSLIYDLIRRYIEQYGVEALFSLSQLPILKLFGIWKKENETEYYQMVGEYMEKKDFDVVTLIQKMVYNSDEKMYNQFCELFDEHKVYELVKDSVPQNIRNYQSTVGYFVGMHKN